MLYSPAPPPFAVSKYASVTLPLKPVLCDKGCALRREWNAKFPWVTVPPVSRALIRNPLPVICERVVQGTLDQVTQGQTWSPEKHLPLSKPLAVQTSSLRAENKEKHVRFRLARSRPHLFQEHWEWYLQSWLQVWPLGNYFISAYPSLLKSQPKASTLQGNASQQYLIQLFMFTIAFGSNTL